MARCRRRAPLEARWVLLALLSHDKLGVLPTWTELSSVPGIPFSLHPLHCNSHFGALPSLAFYWHFLLFVLTLLMSVGLPRWTPRLQCWLTQAGSLYVNSCNYLHAPNSCSLFPFIVAAKPPPADRAISSILCTKENGQGGFAPQPIYLHYAHCDTGTSFHSDFASKGKQLSSNLRAIKKC